MKYILFITLLSCNPGKEKAVVNTKKNHNDTISLKFIDQDDSKILKNYTCKIVAYNEIYPNEEDIENGIQLFPDSLGLIYVSKNKLSKTFFPRFQVCYRDRNTLGFQRFYYEFNNDDTSFIVNYYSLFRVTYTNKDKNSRGDLMKINITKYYNDSIVDRTVNEYNYLEYKLSEYSEPVYFRKNESIKVEVLILKDGSIIKKYDHYLTYKKYAKFELNANNGLMSYMSE